jgi:hypothetical protein
MSAMVSDAQVAAQWLLLCCRRCLGPFRTAVTPAQPTLFRGGKIFTVQPFSRKCPIGHPLDIPFEELDIEFENLHFYYLL